MGTVLRRRGATWGLVLWSGYVGLWMTLTDSSPTVATLWWVAGVVSVAMLLPTYRLAFGGRPASPPAPPGDADAA
jgi:hypothetical protein